MEPIVARIVQRYLKTVQAYKYQPKEKKKTKVDRIKKLIREKTGLPNSSAEGIADAIVRGRDIDALARQKDWPIEDGSIEGPSGSFSVEKVKAAL